MSQNNGIIKVTKWLKDNDSLAVPYDKGTGFCLMERETNISNSNHILAPSQFKEEETNPLSHEGKKFTEKLLQIKKSNLISEEFNNKVEAVGSQPASFYDPAKAHKKTPRKSQ